MLSTALQLLLLTTIYTHAVKPPGYVEPDKPEDPNPPKYAYKYDISDTKENAEHGKEERRDGIHAEGRYYVQDKQNNQDVRYFADDWGYHSAIEYSNVGPHSKSNAKFALGSEAVQLLKNKENNLPQLQGLPNIGRLADATTNQGVQPPNHFPAQPSPADDPETAQPILEQVQQTQQQPELRQVLLIPNQATSPADHGVGRLEFVNPQLATVPHVTDNSLETSALFESTASQPLVTQFLHPRNQEEAYLESFKKFGVKINDVKDQSSRLIENTRDLISGQDVLNINGAATTSNEESSVETSTVTISSTESPQVTTVVTESSLKEQPIVAAESDEKTVSTTSKYEVTEKQAVTDKSESDEVIVTPRPVSTNFLAPITAGIRLENGQHSKSQVEVMESIPYYLGKYEYPLEYAQKNGAANSTNIAEKANEDIELGKTLLFFPTIDFPKTAQQLPNVQTKHKFLENQQQQLVELHNHLDQELAQGYLQHVTVQPDQDIRKVHHDKEPCPQPSLHHVENPRPYPTFTTKYIHRPYPVQLEKIQYVDRPVEKLVPYYIDRPYPVEVKVPAPRPVEKIIEKPVPQYINRPYPVEVKVPVPTLVPVEKIVEKPVPQYIDRPYRVEVKVPVEKIVERPVPHYIDRPYPVPVKVPVHVEKIVEKLVPQYINRPYPVEVKVPVPTLVPVEKIVEKPVPQYIDRPYPVKVPVPVAQHKVVEKPVTGHYLDRPYQLHQFHIVPVITDFQAQKSDCNTQTAQQSQHQFQHYLNPYAYAPQYVSSHKNGPFSGNGYLPPKSNCGKSLQTNHHHSFDIGLRLPRPSSFGKFRAARSSFNDKNIRLEYGFKPPLVPSIEIDEQGNPIEKEEK